MRDIIFFTTRTAGLIAGTALLVTLSGCVTDRPQHRGVYRQQPSVQVQGTVAFQDDYDYYPGYEIYYSRNRREYVYRDGSTWVRRSEPRGVSVDVLLAAPSVRLDFRDEPARHHSRVIQTYPRHWSPQPAVQVQGSVGFQDDYDYYPGYEIYYSRNRREYVYRDGSTWVRRPEPRGVSVDVLFAAPSVRLDFHDEPARHHSRVIQSYPKHWSPPGRDRDAKEEKKHHQQDRKNDRKN